MPVKWRALLLLLTLFVVLPAASSRRVAASRAATAGTAANSPRDKEPREIVRVGVIYYDDFQKSAEKFRNAINRLTKNSNRFDFRLNVGTYDEVLDWYQKNLIDVAVMTPGPVAELLRDAGGGATLLDPLYIGTHGVKPKAGSAAWPEEKGGEGPPRYEYHSVAVVNETAPALSLDGLKTLHDKGEVEFLFVHQLSASGYILPRYILQAKGMTLDASTRNRVHLTYSHDESLRQLVPSRCLEQEPGKPTEYVTDGVRSADGKLKVAFVSDETVFPKILEKMKGKNGDPACKLKQVPIPELNDQLIPQDIVLFSTEFNQKLMKIGQSAKDDIHRQLMELKTKNEPHDVEFILEKQEGWMTGADKVKRWLTALDPEQKLKSQAYTIEQIITRLNNYARQNSASNPLRLALVLSGGGAKCAYQLGAIEALENELEKNAGRGHRDVDISLVVGTSGGAINALPVALGITRGDGQGKLRHTWRSISLGEFISPWHWISSGWGLCLGLLQAVALMRLVLMLVRFTSRLKGRFWKKQNWWLPASLLMLLLGLFETAVFWFEWYPFGFLRPLDKDHNLFHVWSLLLPTLFWTAATLATCGLLFLLVGVELYLMRSRAAAAPQPAQGVAGKQPAPTRRAAFLARQRQRAEIFYQSLDKRGGRAARLYRWRHPLVFWTFMVALLACLLQTYAMVMRAGSFSESAGVEKAMLRAFPDFLSEEKIKPGEDGGHAEQLADLSKQIVGKDLLWRRDLVITASRLREDEEEMGSNFARAADRVQDDMYFYFDARPQSATRTGAAGDASAEEIPPLDNRFIPFKGRNSHLLLDVVIGSSSIFPLYPARLLEAVDTGSPGQAPNMKIIDGGFAHNSPIEAALLWQATHIIVIEATPDEKPSQQKNLLTNLTAAFNYLYTQSQTIDARSRGKVEIFTLRPSIADADEDPNSCLLDFSKRLVDAAIHKGYNDVMNVAEPRFRREPGQPLY